MFDGSIPENKSSFGCGPEIEKWLSNIHSRVLLDLTFIGQSYFLQVQRLVKEGGGRWTQHEI